MHSAPSCQEPVATRGAPCGGLAAIHFTADDGRGETCTGTVFACAPHDQGHPTCVDDGQRYNSLGPCGSGNGLGAEVVANYSLKVGEVTSTQANLEFSLPSDGQVQLSVFDVSGRRLATVENAQLTAGTYQRSWNLGGVPSGMYFVRLQAGGVSLTKTVLKLR